MKNKGIIIRVTDEEKLIIKDNADKAGLSISEYLLKDKLQNFTPVKKADNKIDNKKDNKKGSVHIMIDKESLRKIDFYAKAAHLSRGAYLSKVGTGEKVIIIKELKLFIKELNHIGNNINQLTMLAHQSLIEVIKLDEVNRLLIDIKREIVNLQRKQ